ncbi:MAG: DUF1294 domain-containing protein [Paludibacteraceae bacterium]|nr:DUF1294 domain-containing protein [Paludibacteraceae bacterium]
MKYLFIYLIIINIITFIVYAWDKRKAKKGAWRTPESTLLLLAAVGGSVGALLAMYMLRHKTNHKKFFLGVPAILITQLAIAAYFLLFS